MDKIHHVAIQVSDIKKAVEWYENTFKTRTVYEDKTWALLEFDNLSLALVVPDQHPPHFAVEKQDAEDYGELTVHRDGTASVYIEDPFGNAIEIIRTK